MADDRLEPGVDKPKRWQYPVGVLIILAMALITYCHLRVSAR
jgi:hypothetical protein